LWTDVERTWEFLTLLWRVRLSLLPPATPFVVTPLVLRPLMIVPRPPLRTVDELGLTPVFRLLTVGCSTELVTPDTFDTTEDVLIWGEGSISACAAIGRLTRTTAPAAAPQRTIRIYFSILFLATEPSVGF
jgi:hypothetical protein